MENQKENLNLENQDNVTEQEEAKAENAADNVTSEQPEEVINEPQSEETENEGTEKEETSTANEASSDEETENVDNEVESNSDDTSESYSASYEAQAPVKKKSKAKIIILLVVILAIIGAVAAGLYFFVFNKSDDKFIERSIYLKDNSLYFVNPKDNSSVLITDDFWNSDDLESDDNIGFFYFSAVEFTKDGKKVFYPKDIDNKTSSFSLYYRYLNKDTDPVKLADNVLMYFLAEDEKSVIYMDAYNDVYSHDLEERTKILSDVDSFKVSADALNMLYLNEDGGLYLQPVSEDEKIKIDSDVTSIYKTDDYFENIYYCKNDDLYLKKADSEKIKIDSKILNVILVCDDGGVYYTKENELKGTGTLMDYINDPDGLAESDEETTDSYYSYYYEADKYNEALYRIWTRGVLEETEVDTADSLYYFNGETTELINDSFVEAFDSSATANSIVIKSFDNINVKKVSITDFVNTLDKAENFRSKSIYRSEFEDFSYFSEFKKMILGTLENDASVYVVKNGKQIKIDTESTSNSFKLNENGEKIYYIDNYDSEKKSGQLKVTQIKDGAVSSNDIYDNEVMEFKPIGKDNIVYLKDVKDENGDLYLNKELIEYDVYDYTTENNGKTILYKTEQDSDDDCYTLNIFSNGQKIKIDEDVHDSNLLNTGDIIYLKDYSSKSEKGDIYIYNSKESQKLDFDVKDFWLITDDTNDEFGSANVAITWYFLFDSIHIDIE